MATMLTSLRQLLPLSIKPLKSYNKPILRALTANSYTNIDNKASGVGISCQRRSYTDAASNIIKSSLPPYKVPDMLLTDFIWSNSIQNHKRSDATAVVCGITGRALTYSQLKILCRRLATSLLKQGYKHGDVIAVLMPNMPEFAVVSLGIIEAGLIPSPNNPMYTPDEIAYHLEDSGAVAMIAVPEVLGNALEAKAMLERKNSKYKLRIICTNGMMGSEPELPDGVESYSQLVADNVDDSILETLKKPGTNNNDTVIIPYSSGTTGRPKGVCLSHRNIMSPLHSMKYYLNIDDPTGSNQQEVFLFLLPGFHIYGFGAQLSYGLYTGAKVVTLPLFEESSFINAIYNHKVTVLFMVPPLIQFLGTSPNVTKEHLKSIKLAGCGAAPLIESDLRKLFDKLPPTAAFRQGYGLTETTTTICATFKNSLDKINSVGVVCINNILKVADLQTNRALGPNETGELCVKGEQIMKGYLNNEKANSGAFDSEGWFHTGDIGYYDDEQYFYITDRLKDLIKVKGFQVAPAELESIIKSHPAIIDVGVVGVPDDRKGEKPIAFIRVADGSIVTEEELKAFLAQKVADYKQVDEFIYVESIPKNPTGKILRKELKQIYLEKRNDDK